MVILMVYSTTHGLLIVIEYTMLYHFHYQRIKETHWFRDIKKMILFLVTQIYFENYRLVNSSQTLCICIDEIMEL